MCEICGCGLEDEMHDHSHDHHHHDGHLIPIEQDVLGLNNRFAEDNRSYFTEHHILALNLVSSPGSGKTTLLEKTIVQMNKKFPIAVIEGDQQTALDAERIAKTNVPVIQINTGKVCHLDAHGVGHAVSDLHLQDKSILFIENVGNLVCPALFDLGERHRVVILSVTEGDNKPLKYPYMFRDSDLMIINKMDLLPYVDFNVDRCYEYARQINPKIEIFALSATKDDGMPDWLQWLELKLKNDD